MKGVRFLVRIWGFIAAICAISTGLFVSLTITHKCLIAAIVQISIGTMALLLEAPIFCSYFERLIKISEWIGNHFKYWMKAVLYLGGGIPPFILCPEPSTFLGAGSLVLLAVCYAVLTIAKKGPEDNVEQSKPASSRSDDPESKQSLINNSGEPNDLNTY